ncbi:MAG: hypothetical protein SFZ23_08055 [Planctomycetota bacterium]|nr:hypothetical protein [Planctomycetota bacterium]
MAIKHLFIVFNAVASPALAQIGTASLTWQASLDGGETWSSNEIQTLTGTSIRVRALASWSPDAGYSFASSRFDAFVRGLFGAGSQDTVTEWSIPAPLLTVQTVVSARFGDTIKIDDARDSNPPGRGNYSLSPLQQFEQSGVPHTRANPVAVFQYTLNLDQSAGVREVSSAWFRPPVGAVVPIRLWRGPAGADLQNVPATTLVPLRINVVVPAPAPTIVVATGMACMLRRRR